MDVKAPMPVVATTPIAPTVSRFEIVSTLEVLARWVNAFGEALGVSVDRLGDDAIVLLHETLERVRRYDFDEVVDLRDQLARVKAKHARATQIISTLMDDRERSVRQSPSRFEIETR